MDEFGGSGLDTVIGPARWEAAIAGYAALQVAALSRRERLLVLGCPASSLAQLPAGLLALIGDEQATMRGDAVGLTAAEITRLRDLVLQIAQMCDRLDACGVPTTLEHGDLWASNIIARFDGSYRYFDWSDSAIAHPFFSLFLFLKSATTTFPADTAMLKLLRDCYLDVWSLHLPLAGAREAFALAQRLAPLHHAVTYHQRILPAMWQRWEMERMVPFYLRQFLDACDRQ